MGQPDETSYGDLRRRRGSLTNLSSLARILEIYNSELGIFVGVKSMKLRQRAKGEAGKVSLDMTRIGHTEDSGEDQVSVEEVQAACQGDEMKAGYLDKKCISIFDGLMPAICDCRRKWKLNRFIIVAGGFIYRFKDETSIKLKGVPISLAHASVKGLRFTTKENESNEIEEPFCFEVATLRKRYVFRASSATECKEWVDFLTRRKFATIKEGLGHAEVSAPLRGLNAKARRMIAEKIARDIEMQEESRQEMEGILEKQMPSGTMNPMAVKRSM